MEQSGTNLQLYWDLASHDHEIRLNAGNALIENLKIGQDAKDFVIQDESEISEACSPDVAYAFKRLIRGLASSRDAARLGFSMTLSQVKYIY